MIANLFTGEVLIFNQVALDELLRGPNGATGKYVEILCVQAEGIAKELCPVDTGRLSTSIRGFAQQESGEVVGYVGSDVEYAIYPEFGTAYQDPQPYLRPAVEQVLADGSTVAIPSGWLS